MSDREDAFLARWSRRKREARREAEEQPIEQPQEPAAAPEAIEAEAQISAEEIEALPKIEELTAESDLSGFLRKGIPQALRNAALRRMWSVDPSIRDYVGDARDYAWDWNVVGGVPGNGPMLPNADVAGMVRGILGHHPDPEQEGQETQTAGQAEDAAPGPTGEPEKEAPQLASNSVRLSAPVDAAREAPLAQAEPETRETTPDSPFRVRPRRHGGAIPG